MLVATHQYIFIYILFLVPHSGQEKREIWVRQCWVFTLRHYIPMVGVVLAVYNPLVTHNM